MKPYLCGNGMATSADFKRTAHRVRTALETREKARRAAVKKLRAERLAQAAEAPAEERGKIFVPPALEVPRMDPRERHRLCITGRAWS